MATTPKKTSGEPAPALVERRARALKTCLGLVAAGVIALGWAACLSFDPADPPGTMVYPLHERAHNLAGRAGAAFSAAAFHWLGAGVWPGLLFGAAAAMAAVLGRPLKDMWLRLIGLALIMAALATLCFLAEPSSSASSITGGGGVLGVGSGLLLQRQFGPYSWVIALTGLLIGLVLAADEIVLKVPALLAAAWKRRRSVAGLLKSSTTATAAAPAPAPTSRAKKSAAASAEKPVEAPAAQAPAEPEPPKRVSIMQAAEIAKDKPKGKPAAPAADADANADKKPAAEGPQARTGKSDAGLLSSLFNSASVAGEAGSSAAAPAKPAPHPAPPARKSRPDEPPTEGDYPLPDKNMLIEAESGYIESQQVQVELKGSVLQQTLNDFNVEAQVIGHMTGPVITLFELSLAPGVKVSRIASLSGDIARALAAPSVRIVSPIPGKDTIGIEVPNVEKETVRLKQLMELAPAAIDRFKLPLYLGKDASGETIVADLAAMPHMLIAGTTGSGKSVCINTIIMSMLMTRRPEDVRLIMVDPKMVEMAAFERIPHLLCPIVNDMHKAESILEWAATKMDERYELLKEAGVRNIAGFNALGAERIYKRFNAETDEEKIGIQTHLPYMVVIVDELADLIMTSSKEVEEHIIRIAQKARAVGIHLILATQRPSANVVTGLIKSNMPCRVSFQVASGQESRIVLDQKGAELLLGRGDMLFLKPGTSMLVRAQGTYLDDAEIHDVVDYIVAQRGQSFNSELVAIKPAGLDGDDSGERDELFDKAVEIILAAQRGSVSLLQRRLSIGYTRSSRIVDQMAEAGILGDYKGSQARECNMTLEDWHALQSSIAADRSGDNSLNGEPTSE